MGSSIENLTADRSEERGLLGRRHRPHVRRTNTRRRGGAKRTYEWTATLTHGSLDIAHWSLHFIYGLLWFAIYGLHTWLLVVLQPQRGTKGLVGYD